MRISDDKAGDAHGVATQEKNGRRHAETRGWKIGRVIVENDTSAFKRKRIKLPNGRSELRTVRPGFRLALDLLACGAHDGLLSNDLDRVARDPRDLEDLIDVVESRKPRIPVDSVTGSLRLATDSEITMARVMVAIANKSSRDTARRIVDRQAELAEQGRPAGGYRGYGYSRDGMTIIEEEAAVIRWMAERVLDPDEFWSVYRIADRLTEQGIPTATGLSTWPGRSVTTILRGPRVAGLRRYRGQIVGEAAWPAILERDTWEQVCAELASRARGGDGTLKRWLTLVLFCGLCDWPLKGGHQNTPGKHRYWCATPNGGCGKITISAEHAEAEIERQILEYLGDPRVLRRLRTAQDTVDLQRVRSDLAADEAQLKELAAEWAHRKITLGEYRAARGIIEERLEQNRALLMMRAPQAVRRLMTADDMTRTWHDFAPSDRREVALAVVRGYQVMPGRPGRGFDPMRLVPLTDGAASAGEASQHPFTSA